METSSPKIVNIYTEVNPNPNSLKFVVDFMLLPEAENLDFAHISEADKCPLAKDLFKFNFVKRVFITANFVTVTKDEAADWAEISPMIKSFIKGYLEEGKPLLVGQIDLASIEDEPEVVTKIKVLLDEYVRPAVEQDGGAITFHSFVDGIVKVTLRGSCSGCPSSTVTLKAGIENLLKRMVPEVQEVVAEGV
jgi:Fe-S cluster biogenesis protein NfuA